MKFLIQLLMVLWKIGINLRKVYMSNISVYMDNILILSKLFINGCSLQPSWYWARNIDTNLMNYFPEYRSTKYSRDFVGYDLPYIYSLSNAYTAGDMVCYNQIWQLCLWNIVMIRWLMQQQVSLMLLGVEHTP